MALIPKKPGADHISDFRPIAIANYVIKIITKIISDRLGGIAPWIISSYQSRFVRGRHIHTSIGMVSKCYNMLDYQITGGNVGIKFDIAKAFDIID